MGMSILKEDANKQWPQYLAVASAVLLAVGSGLHLGWPSPSIKKLLDHDLPYNVTSEDVSYITSISPIGYLVGSPAAAVLLQTLGRKTSLLLLSVPQIIAWLLIATSTSVSYLYVARFISGIGEGGVFTSLPVYLCEVSEPQIRGALGTTLTVAVIIGILMINLYGSYASVVNAAYISLILPLLFVFIFMWMPESPYFLIAKGEIENARTSLRALRKVDNVENELQTLTCAIQRQLSEPGSFKDLFRIRSNLRAFLIVIGLRTVQVLSGVFTFIAYIQVVFYQSGSKLGPVESTVIYTLTQLLVTSGGSLLADRLGRRTLIIASTAGSAIFLYVEGLYFYFYYYDFDLSSFTWVPATGMILYVMVNSIGLSWGPNLVMGEIFSTKIKSKALSLANIYFAICNSCVLKLFHFLDERFGMSVPFFFYGTSCVVGLAFCYLFVPETKNKSLEDIQQMLKKEINCSRKLPFIGKKNIYTISK